MPAKRPASIAPWLGLVAAICVQILAGNPYNFPLYSHKLKKVLGYNQVQLSNLGVANDVGENVGLLAGLLCNKMPPWSILSVGAVSGFFGYGLVWLSVSGIIRPLPYLLVWLALCIGTNSSTWFNTAVLVTNMRNFPLSRGTLAGILKGYVGISAALYTEIYTGLLDKDSTKLLLFLTMGIPAICILVMYFIKPCTPFTEEGTRERRYFIFIQANSIILALYLLLTAIIDDVVVFQKSFISRILVGIMFLLLLAPIGIPIRLALRALRNRHLHLQSSSVEEHLLVAENTEPTSSIDKNFKYSQPSKSGLVSASMEKPESEDVQQIKPSEYVSYSSYEIDELFPELLLAEGEGAVMKKRRPRRGEDFKLHQALIKADFWLLFLAYFCGVGSGVTVLNNLAQIGASGGLQDVTILLSLFSLANFLGRMGGGALSEHFVRSRKTPRTVWMVVSQVLMIVGHLIFAFSFKGSLYIGCSLLGLCYGVQFSVMVPTASELFGLKHFGIIYNFLTMGNPLGALLLSGFLAGYLYDKEAAKQSAFFADSLFSGWFQC
eukprot:TRINITY_DN1144_c0_g1_i1.p1 TRINITY_DN1144_c0_g1~~TRINITY_DN1144_c0_g1_i1.p1  ORF type:complete len:549 (+),score=44.01 TRINITY_DN1144_c0_g1_i1:182-1828(+)